jgi:hypothetical protein
MTDRMTDRMTFKQTVCEEVSIHVQDNLGNGSPKGKGHKESAQSAGDG